MPPRLGREALIVKIALIGIGALVLLVVVVVAIGYALPVKHRGVAESTFRATPDKIFALITDVGAFPSWRSGVKSVEVIPSNDDRKRFREVSGDGSIAYVVEAAEPNRRVVTRIDDKSLPFGGTWTYDISPDSDGRTRLRITEAGEIYNPIFRFVSRFVLGYDRTMKTYIADIGKKIN